LRYDILFLVLLLCKTTVVFKDHKEHTELNLASVGELGICIQFSGLKHLYNILDVDLENINVGSKLKDI